MDFENHSKLHVYIAKLLISLISAKNALGIRKVAAKKNGSNNEIKIKLVTVVYVGPLLIADVDNVAGLVKALKTIKLSF